MIRIHLVLTLEEEMLGRHLSAMTTRDISTLMMNGSVRVELVGICTQLSRKGNGNGAFRYCEELTGAEKRVLLALTEHDTIQEVADALCLSAGTVRKHLEHIYQKLDVHSLHRAIAVAFHRQLLIPKETTTTNG
jgi:DNA-binding CsgD family transcriptional regulator